MKKIIMHILLSILIILTIVSSNVYATNKKMLGDINEDNLVDSRDQLQIMRHIMASARKTHPEWILTGDKLKLADVTQNNKVDNSDMLRILRYIAAKRNPEKIGNKHKEWLEIGEIDLEPEQLEVEPEPTPDVPKPEPKTIEVSSIKLNKTTLSLDMRGTKTATLKATIEPSTATNKSVTYSSSNAKVATVDKNGKITAKGNGTATITAKTSNGKTATCKVTVTTSPISIKLSKTSMTINLDKSSTKKATATLKATINPSTASNKTISWSSSNTKIVSVKNGVITANKDGTVTITAKTANGKKATCKVTVRSEYWEVKNGKYIFHYSDGTKKILSKSCYNAMKKIKDIKAKDPNLPNESKLKNWKSSYKYAGIYHEDYCCENQTANNLAKKNGTSPYAIAVDLNVANVHIFRKGKSGWIPDRTYVANVGTKNFNNAADLKYKKKDSKIMNKQWTKGATAVGLFYVNGSRWYDAGDANKYWVEFGVQNSNYNNGLYLHYSPYAPDQSGSVEGVTGEAKGSRCNGGCITVNKARGEWIYKHIGRGTPILIY